jgi:hypothetical protein
MTQSNNNNQNPLIEINPKNLKLTMMKILSEKQKGAKHITLQINQKTTTIPLSKITSSLSTFLYNLTTKTNTTITQKNIPQCILQRNLLKPPIKEKFENIILSTQTPSNEKTLLTTCKDCMEKPTCKGISKTYLQKFGPEEFLPLIPNKNKLKPNQTKISSFQSTKLKQLCQPILLDYQNDPHYLRKRIVFCNSYPQTLEESSTERLIYYIFNRKDDLAQNLNLLKNYFDPNILNPLEKYLQKSNQLVISLAKMSDENIRKTLYFNTNNLNKNELKNLLKTLNLKTKKMKSHGESESTSKTTPSHTKYTTPKKPQQKKNSSTTQKNFKTTPSLKNSATHYQNPSTTVSST